MSLAIIVLNFRTPALTVDCLHSLAGEIAGVDGARVVVVDNASGDDSVEKITAAAEQQGWSQWASVLPLDRNGGYSAGNNAGIRLALAGPRPAEYVLLLNPDTIVRPGALAALVEFMDRHPRVGIAGSRLENTAGGVDGSARRMPTPWSELESAARSGPVTRLLGRHVVPMPLRDEPHRCDWVSGASIVVRGRVFEEIGLLDEGYFLYYDEVDFCTRAKRAGWECWYVPASRVLHLEGASTGIRTPRKRRAGYWYDSRRRFFAKHYGLLGLLAADGLWALGRSILLARQLAGLGGSTEGDPARYTWDLLWGDVKAMLAGTVVR